MNRIQKHYALAAIALVIVGFFVWRATRPDPNELPYVAVDEDVAEVTRIATGLGPISRIQFSPAGDFMLVGVLTGEIYAFQRTSPVDQPASWIMQSEPILTIKTAFPGFPPEENGLTGIAFAADYAESFQVFFTYTYQAAADDYRNRVARAQVTFASDQVIASPAVDIYELKTPAAPSHQIQGIVGVMVEGVSHALFTVGEGFEADRALNVAEEAGKLMLVAFDGSDPRGTRPYPDQPKIQAIGLRNPPDLAINFFDPLERLAILDTGPDKNDRFIYGDFLSDGEPVQGLNLGWDGTTDSLAALRLDENTIGTPDLVLHKWDPTHTATNIVFHPGKGGVPTSTAAQATVLTSLFGRTNETGKDKPGREIWLGALAYDQTQPQISWNPFVVRSAKGINEPGHPLGLAVDPVTYDVVFGDILEGALYWVTIKE